MAHVKVPSLSRSTDAEIYMYYGNSLASNQENITAAWDSNFKMVQHLKDSTVTKELFAGNASSYQISTPNYLAENIVYDSVTAKYWWVFSDVSSSPFVIRMASATSPDGPWTVEGSPVISEAGHWVFSPHIVKFGEYWYIYYDRNDGLVTTAADVWVQKSSSVNTGYSTTGISNPILTRGTSGQWDERRATEPYAFQEGNTYYLFYMGEDVANLYEKTGYATSSSPTGGFTKYGSNPVLSGHSELGYWNSGQDKAADPFVFKKDGTFYIGVSAVTSGKEVYGTIGFFKTTDFVNFTEVNFNPVLPRGRPGNWDDVSVIRGAVSEFGGTYYLSYAGNGGSGYRMGMTTLQFNTTDSHTPVIDSTLNNITGIKWSANNPNEVDAKISKGQDFSSDYINISPSSSLDITGDVTVSLWFNADTWASDYNFLLRKNSGSSYNYEMVQDGSVNTLGFYSYDTTDRYATIARPTTGGWHYVVGVRSGTNLYIYLDSIKGTDGSIGTPVSGTGNMSIGTLLNYYDLFYFDGVLDEIRISATARSADWISTEYNNQNSPSTFYSVGSELQVYASQPGISLNNDPSGRPEDKTRLTGNVNTGNTSYSVSAVDYSVNGGSWQGATATDGSFNTSNEDFYFDFSQTDNNYKEDGYTIRVRAQNSSGIWKDNIFYFKPFNLDSPANNSYTTNSLPTFSFSINKGEFSNLKDNLSKFQVLINKDNKGWQTYIDNIPVDYTSVQNNGDNLQKNSLSTNGNGIYENNKIWVNYSNNNSSIQTYSKAVDNLGNASDKSFEDGGHKLSSGSYQFKVVAVDKAGHSQETETRKLRINSKQFQASQAWFPLTIDYISGIGKLDLSTIHPQDIKDEYFTSYFAPTIKGIARAGTTVTLTNEDTTCETQNGTNCTSSYTATTGIDSRYTITFPKNSLRFGRPYTITLSVKDSGDNYNELPAFKLRVGQLASESTKVEQTTESPTPTTPTTKIEQNNQSTPTPTPASKQKHCFLFICW